MGVRRDSGLNSNRTSSSKTREKRDTSRLNANRPSYSSRSKSRSSSRSSSSSSFSNFSRPTLSYSSDKNSVLNNAPSKSITQNYKVAETANPFIKDALSLNQKYNTYQRQVANPEYNNYISNKNEQYNNKYNNFRWGNYNWNNLSQNDFQGEQKMQGIYQQQNPDNVFGPSQRLNLAQRALFG